MRKHVHQLRGRTRTVPTDVDVGVGPVATQRGQEAHQDHGIFGPRGAGTRPQGGRDERMGGSFENEQRQVAMILIVMVIKGKLLLPIRRIIGMVHIKDNRLRRLGVTGNKVVDQGPRETREVFTVYLVFQTGEGRRAGSVLRGVQGGPIETELEERSMAEAIGIVPVGIPRSDLIDALGQQVTHRMVYGGLMALIMDRCREARGQPNLTVNASQEECTKVRRQGTTLEIRTYRLTGGRRKTQLFWARIGHQQTSCGFSRMD